MWVFPAFFSAAGVTGRGEATRSRLVDTRREAVGVEERPFSRDFSKGLEERWSQKRGGAKGGAPRYIRRTATSLAPLLRRRSWSGAFFTLRLGVSFALVPLLLHGLGCAAPPVVQLSSCGSALLLWFSSSCGSAPPVVQLLLWSGSWSCGATCSLEARLRCVARTRHRPTPPSNKSLHRTTSQTTGGSEPQEDLNHRRS